jgi:hypothetical protein
MSLNEFKWSGIWVIALAAGSFGLAQEAVLDAETRSAVVEEINQLLIEQYIFLDVAREMTELLDSKLKNGDYDAIDDPVRFAGVLREDLHSVSHDNHFFMEFNPERADLIRAQDSRSSEEVARAETAFREDARRINYGFRKVESLKGNVGYLDLRLFSNPEYGGDTAIAAMNFLASSDAVIIDLRDTPGGYPTMVQLLCSYFVEGGDEGRTHLNSFERRHTDSIEQFWTLPYVPGPRMYDLDLYVLINNNTGSGAEEFTYNVKNLERATIVGETTRGSAHPIDAVVIQEVFVLHLPNGRPVNPISGENWERTGIAPHVEVPSDKALDTAYRMALEKLLQNVEDEGQAYQLNWALDGLNADLDPVEVQARTLKSYAGEYGPRTVRFRSGELFYQRRDTEYRLIPLKEHVFRVEGLDFFRIEFEVDESGDVEQLIGLYDDGYRTPSPRTK